ncbi:MAG TPA: NlpC/P60 family protein [Candidatus Aminicenantes bacterium]|nr:NlpC/P60 family protein [Candidatus Aminicenantes bacterium]
MRSLSSRPISPFPAVSVLILLVFSVLLPSCRPRARVLPLGPAADPGGGPSPGYQVQAGAFSLEDNAARLTRSLREQGWNAFYLYHETRVFKVRIGPFRTREKAVEAAGALLGRRLIADFLIIPPGSEIVPGPAGGSEDDLRDRLASTALGFVEFPYVWGGASPEEGFDCSGLAMTVYRLNGLLLPRALADQAEAGRAVSAGRAKKGDLVFFSMDQTGRASHVGILIGGNRFVHAPGRNKAIRPDSLANPHFRDRLMEIRSYL